MQQIKIVVKVTMNGHKKTRKALQTVVGVSGVESAALVGSNKDQIAVTGAGIDSVQLTNLLRKRVGFTELLSVGPVEEKKPESKPTAAPLQIDPYQHYYHNYGMPYYYHVY